MTTKKSAVPRSSGSRKSAAAKSKTGKKAGRRPRSEESGQASNIKTIRLTDAERRQIEYAAQRKGVSAAEFIRTSVIDRARDIIYADENEGSLLNLAFMIRKHLLDPDVKVAYTDTMDSEKAEAVIYNKQTHHFLGTPEEGSGVYVNSVEVISPSERQLDELRSALATSGTELAVALRDVLSGISAGGYSQAAGKEKLDEVQSAKEHGDD